MGEVNSDTAGLVLHYPGKTGANHLLIRAKAYKYSLQ